MNDVEQTILVIAPYTKRVGVAIFRGSELLHFAVKTFSSPRTIEAVRSQAALHLNHLIAHFQPRQVIAKTLTTRQTRSALQMQLINEIKRISKAHRIEAKLVSLDNSKRRLSTHNRPTLESAFAQLGRTYPELSKFGRSHNHAHRAYYRPVLSAVAIGLTYQKGPGKV